PRTRAAPGEAASARAPAGPTYRRPARRSGGLRRRYPPDPALRSGHEGRLISLVDEELSAHRVAVDPGPGPATGCVHLVEAGPRELQDGRPVACLDAVVDRCADRDQLHLAQALAVEADVSRDDDVERLLIPQLRLHDSPSTLDQRFTSYHRALPVCGLPLRRLRHSITADFRGARSGMRFGRQSPLDEGGAVARSMSHWQNLASSRFSCRPGGQGRRIRRSP